MFDADSPLTKGAIAELTKREVYEKLIKYVLWRTQSGDEAKDLLADAIECVGDPDRRPWNPTKCTLFQHMRRVMDVLAIERAQGGDERRAREARTTKSLLLLALARPTSVRYLSRVEREIDPVIEAYKKDVDRGLLREALRLTPEQRIRELIKLQRLAAELQKGRGRKEST